MFKKQKGTDHVKKQNKTATSQVVEMSKKDSFFKCLNNNKNVEKIIFTIFYKFLYYTHPQKTTGFLKNFQIASFARCF